MADSHHCLIDLEEVHRLWNPSLPPPSSADRLVASANRSRANGHRRLIDRSEETEHAWKIWSLD
jgi:hypothetical protein